MQRFFPLFPHPTQFCGQIAGEVCSFTACTRLRMRIHIYGEFAADSLQQLGFLVNSPNQQGDGLPFLVLERDDDFTKSQQPFQKITRIHPGVVVFSAYLLAGFGGAFLEIHVVRRDSHIMKKTFKPGKVIASKSGKFYHSPKCDWAKKIKKKNQVWFDDEKEAKKKFKAHSCVG